MRHVASKLPSLQADAETTASVPAAASQESQVNGHTGAGGDKDEVLVPRGANADDEERLELLYDQIAWPLGKTYGHPYDAFKLALTCVLTYSLHK